MCGWRTELGGAFGTPEAWFGAALAAGCGWDVFAHRHSGPERCEADLYCDLRSWSVPDRRWRRDVEADQQGLAIAADSRSGCGGGPLRASHCDASVAAWHLVYAEALGRDA